MKEKTECRITIPAKGAPRFCLRWPEFCEKYHADPAVVAALKSGNGADRKNWYVCESEIPVADFSTVELATDIELCRSDSAAQPTAEAESTVTP